MRLVKTTCLFARSFTPASSWATWPLLELHCESSPFPRLTSDKLLNWEANTKRVPASPVPLFVASVGSLCFPVSLPSLYFGREAKISGAKAILKIKPPVFSQDTLSQSFKISLPDGSLQPAPIIPFALKVKKKKFPAQTCISVSQDRFGLAQEWGGVSFGGDLTQPGIKPQSTLATGWVSLALLCRRYKQLNPALWGKRMGLRSREKHFFNFYLFLLQVSCKKKKTRTFFPTD